MKEEYKNMIKKCKNFCCDERVGKTDVCCYACQYQENCFEESKVCDEYKDSIDYEKCPFRKEE